MGWCRCILVPRCTGSSCIGENIGTWHGFRVGTSRLPVVHLYVINDLLVTHFGRYSCLDTCEALTRIS